MAATKGIRLNESIRKEFEDFCRDNLLDERAVIEAWLVRFLEASNEERRHVAMRYVAWLDEHNLRGKDSGSGLAALMRKSAANPKYPKRKQS